MSLHLYDTSSRSLRPFVPINPGEVSMYLCGATVQSNPHVGHLRSGLVFDVLTRWLLKQNYKVTLCRNVTDIDDKILHKAIHEERPWWAVAQHYERAFQEAYSLLGCIPPTIEPRATGHVTQMVELMEELIKRGHAYASNGDVYFDVRSFEKYGSLSNQKPDDMLAATDSEHAASKKDVRDFALWKGSKPGEPAWPTPWGAGRPGWHLECSAMAAMYLGDNFDIHGGGLDLVFPHHENEIAQSKAAGQKFANYWLHNAWVTTAGEKMSKSLGNSLIVFDVLERIRAIELRWYLVSAHYRSNLEFSDEALQESGAAFRRIEGFINRASEIVGEESIANVTIDPGFSAAMNDDLGVPAALAVVHEIVTEGNIELQKGAKSDLKVLSKTLHQVRAMLDVLGVDPLAANWNSSREDSKVLKEVIDALVANQLQMRQQAREHKDFAKADEIRDSLANAGIAIDDTQNGARWSVMESEN
ncbi:MAG: cysteine--tRNA ligase [Actinobacteria bacterium]|nr:cysteine--tRNA ligase [Actinomycetota bacterium]